MADQTTSDVGRRTVLRGAAVGGVGLPLLAACGGGGSSGSGAPSTSAPGGPSSGGADGGGSGALASTSDVPVGGGTIVSDQQVVLTQPTKGEFKAFSAICTHMGCPVSSISEGRIHCPCHASAYSIEDGSVLGGPAPRPLPPVSIAVEGGEIVRA
jgi:Rieske Fe-S protein